MTEITRHGPEVLDRVRPFWLAMVHHHAAVAPELGPVHADDESWTRRRKAYEQYLAEPDAFALLARHDGRDAGYAIVTVDPGSPTFVEPERYAFVGSLSVLPELRGQGIGTALIERAQQEVSAVGVSELRLDVMAGNRGAVRFYERLGFQTFLVGLRRP